MSKKKSGALVLKKLLLSWHKAAVRFLALGGFSSHNQVTIFHDGDEAFSAIFLALSLAEESIYIETYILANDRVGQKLRDVLIESRKRGVAITVIFDHVGSAGLSHAFLRSLRDAGIKILGFNPIWPWRRHGPLLFRDHRKIIVIDKKLAFCGSMNMSADYAGKNLGTDRFRDTVAQVMGPAVIDLFAITEESIAESEFNERPETAIKKVLTMDRKSIFRLFFNQLLRGKIAHLEANHDGTLIQVLRSNMRRELAHIQKSMEEAVNRAVNYCYFTTPYFLPQEGLKKALENAKRRGVDVRILTSGLSDIPLMRYASHHVYQSFLKRGIRIYEMTQKTLHAKIATIDGLYSSLGSYNLDHWSARRNLEVNLAIIDQNIALKLEAQFGRDLALSQEINPAEFSKRSIIRRFLCWVAYVILRL